MFFDRQLGIDEPTPRIARDGQKSDPIVHVTEIGVVTEFQLARNPTLLLPELRRQSIENRILDLVVEVIDVNPLHPLAKSP